MKTSFLKTLSFYVFLFLFLITGHDSYGQWDSPGTQLETHGPGGQPIIQGNGAQLEYRRNQNGSSGAVNGLRFSQGQSVGGTTEAYFFYNTSSKVFRMTDDDTNDIKFSLSAASGNMNVKGSADIGGDTEVGGVLDITGGNTAIRVDGDEALWYDGDLFSWGFSGTRNRFADPITIGADVKPPSGTALVTTSGQEIKMVGDNSYIQWHTAAASDPDGGNSGFIGSNQFGSMFVESNIGTVTIDGEAGINFLISDSGANAMTIDASKNVGIGTNTPAYKFQVAGNADVTGELTAASDMRLKEDIEDLTSALDKIAMLHPVTYKFKTTEFPTMQLPTRQKMGFLAQDVESVLPELVSSGTKASDIHGNSFDSKSVNYIEMIPMLTKAIQEQQAIIENLKSEMASLKTMVAHK